MPRPKRVCPAGNVFHVLNRAVARMTIFEKPEDYDAFLRVIEETWRLVPLPIYGLAVMPNHWHFVVRPAADGQVSEFFRRLTVTHTMRWHSHYHTGGSGHLYQGRFKSFLVQDDEHLWTVLRYVERNPVRANFTERAELWRWSSAWLRRQKAAEHPWLTTPAEPSLPRNWLSLVNQPQNGGGSRGAAQLHSSRRTLWGRSLAQAESPPPRPGKHPPSPRPAQKAAERS